MAIVSINDIVKNVRDLPSLPAVVMQLLTCIDQEDAGSRLLGEKISHDQALAAKTLRLANSSFYGMQRKVSSIQQAIAILGFDSVRMLVAAVAVTGAFTGGSSGRFSFDTFWRHSVATAICAKLLSRHMRVDKDNAFIAGLLHDIGRLVLVVRYPEQYEAVLEYSEANNCRLLEAERRVLGIEHTQVGRALAEHWKFPATIQNAVSRHHDTDMKKAEPLVAAVQIANGITFGLAPAATDENMTPPLSAETLNEFGIGEAMHRELLDETARQFEEVSQMLRA